VKEVNYLLHGNAEVLLRWTGGAFEVVACSSDGTPPGLKTEVELGDVQINGAHPPSDTPRLAAFHVCGTPQRLLPQ
jgi:hypothetical protein